MKRTLSIFLLFFGLILGFSQMKGIAIKWILMEDSHFYFDTPDITKIPFDRYPQVKDTKGRNIVIPYKAVVKGQKEFIGARIIIEDPKLKEAKIEFKVLGSGKLINAELISNTGNQREYKLELKGVFSYGEEEIMAVLLPSENQQTSKVDNKQKELKEAKQKIIGSFRLVHLEPKNINLSLVPLDKASEAELDTIAENIHNTYSKAGINFDIKKQPVLDISAITTKDIDTPDDNPLSHYSKMQQSINRLYPAKINEYVLFITEKASSTGQKGFMPLGGQYGYAYKSKDKNTPAHELGHGVFRLEHPWSNKLIKTPRASTNLLMDSAGAAELSHFDWKQINDPKIKIYAFQKQEEGELTLNKNEYLGFAPNGRVITSYPKNYTDVFKSDSYFITGFHSSDGIYIWDGNVYRKGNDVFTPIDKPITGKVAIWVNSKNPNCYAWYKFIEVKNYTAKDFNKIKNLIKKDNGKGWAADLVHNASESCITESKKEQEEGIVIPELVGNQNYYKIENTLQQAKASFGSNADIEFSHNGKVYKQNDNGKVEEVKNALSTQQINNGEWSGNVENKIRFTTDEKNVVQVEAFGLNKNIKWKSTNIQKVSNNIREKTNAFLKENNVKDLNAAYSDNTGTFADGDKIKINGSFGKIISEGIEVTTELLKDGQIKEQVYLSSSKAAIHAPGVVTGSFEASAQKVTDLTSLANLAYDIATDKQTRADIADQFQNIKDQIGDNPKEFFPILGEVILTIGTGNSSEEWDKSVNSKDNGEKSHFATRGVVNTVFTAATFFSSVKELPKFSQKLGEEIKKVKKAGNFIKNGKFIDELLEADYQKYLTRKSKQGKTPKDRLEWKESRDYWLNDSPMARGNEFNKKAWDERWYPYWEVYLDNGKFIDGYNPITKEIVSRKATELIDIQEETFIRYLNELNNKYAPPKIIKSKKIGYEGLYNKELPIDSKLILEIPESNKTFKEIDKYIKIAKEKGIEIRFRPE